jgi:hypothetical protein
LVLPLMVLVMVAALTGCESDHATGVKPTTLVVDLVDPEEQPLVGVEVTVFDVESRTATTDEAGRVRFTDLLATTVWLRVRVEGFRTIYREVAPRGVAGSLELRLTRYDAPYYTFEGAAVPAVFEHSGDAPWGLAPGQSHDGSTALQSGDIERYEDSTVSLTVDFDVTTRLSFWFEASSEAYNDYLVFRIDGSVRDYWADQPWAVYIEDLPPGQHELRWTYEKDGSVDHGDDCARIDDVRFEVLD